MHPALPRSELAYPAQPLRYRSLQTLLLLAVFGSLVCSYWLLPSRLERVMAALDRGDQPILESELTRASERQSDPGETRALADVALTLGEPEIAAAILEQSLARQPSSVPAMRRLLEVQRQRHRMRDVAALDERIYASTGEADALREAADIYASQRRVADRIDALRRLYAIGRATAPDMAELAHRLSDAGAGREASSLVMGWLNGQADPLPPEIVALAAGLSANDTDAEAVATRLGVLIGRSGEVGPFHMLIQTYAERGHPNLSLSAGLALGETMQGVPEVALLLAQLEASNGQFAAARQRLDALDRAGKLLSSGLPILADLSLQLGDVTRAATLTGSIAADQMPQGFPHRLVDAAMAAGRMDVLARIAIEPIAVVSPGSAAVIALAQGNRGQAERLARTALGPTADLADLGLAFRDLIKTFGLEHAAILRVLNAARAGALDEAELSLLLDVSATSRREGPAVLQVLRAQRDLTPRAGVAWATAAARAGGSNDVVVWLRAHGGQMPSEALLEVLALANERANGGLARMAASALMGRSDLPDGWSPAEIAFEALATEPLTMARLRDGLALIGAAQTEPAARQRLVASLVGARDFTAVAKDMSRLPEHDGATEWLVSAANDVQSPDVLAAELALLANIAPHRALAPLARVWATDVRHLLPLYAAALIRDHQVDAAQTVVTSGLRGLAPKQQDAVLYDALAGLRTDEALPLLRIGARSGRDDWVAAYQEALARAGLVEELRADLRLRAAAPSLEPARRVAIASRLVELNDRAGAIAILEKLATGLRPNNPVVEQLVFLWGPRATPDSIGWTRGQAIAAPLSDLPKWLEHLAYLGAPLSVIEMVQARPAVLSVSAPAVRTFGASLIAADVATKPDLAAAIAAHATPEVSSALAQLALDTGQARPAWQAAREALSHAPNDPALLLLAAQAAASLRRSSEAAALYARLLALGPQEPAIMIDAGDAMLAAKQTEAGRRVVTSALLRLPDQPPTLAAARLRARALLLLQRTDDAVMLLQVWLGRFPNHAGLRADLLQARLDGRAGN